MFTRLLALAREVGLDFLLDGLHYWLDACCDDETIIGEVGDGSQAKQLTNPSNVF
jgi:hypothetical protein